MLPRVMGDLKSLGSLHWQYGPVLLDGAVKSVATAITAVLAAVEAAIWLAASSSSWP